MSKRIDFIDDALASNTDDCLVWPFAVRKSSGYGAHSGLKNGKKLNYDVHRFVCKEAHGSAPNGLPEAAHTCGNKLCINPRHLYWASHKQNMDDAKKHGTIRGGGRHRQRIFADDVAFIANSDLSLIQLAEKFQTSASYIGRLRRSAA
jgi:hypothetical protein